MKQLLKNISDKLHDLYDEENKEFRQLVTSSLHVFSVLAALLYLNRDKKNSQKLNAIFNALGGRFLMANLMQAPINTFFASLKPFMPTFLLVDKYKNTITQINKKYNNLKPTLTDEQKTKIEDLISDAQKFSYMSMTQSNSSLYNKRCENIISFTQHLLVVLRNDKYEILQGTIEEKNKFLTNAMLLIKGYDQKTYLQITEKIIMPFIGRSCLNMSLPIAPIYLLGEPGVGKTRFVDEFAIAMNVPVKKVNFSTIKPQHFFISSPDEESAEPRFSKEFFNFVTQAVYESMLAGKGGCCIIFLDEIDKAIKHALVPNSASAWKIQFLLDMLNSKLEFFRDLHIGFGVPARKILFIAAGNIDLAQLCDEQQSQKPNTPNASPGMDYYTHSPNRNHTARAIADRFYTIRFPAIKPKLKDYIVREYINSLSVKNDITPSYAFKVKFKNTIQTDKEPGVRKLTNKATLLFAHDATQRVFAGTILDTTNKTDQKYASITIQRAWREAVPRIVARKWGI